MPVLAIIILNYNRADLLIDCLKSIFASPHRCTVQVWVVDNASQDDSVALVQQHFPQVHVIVSPSNGGFAYGNNLALRRLLRPWQNSNDDPEPEPDYIVLLNNDTIVPAGTLDALVAYLEAHDDVGVVGPKVLLPDGSLDLACRRSFPTPEVALYRMVGLSRLFPHHRRFGRYNMTYLDPDSETDVDSVVGACMMLRASVIREVGLLDERFFMYGEDLDWAYRIKQYGWRIVYYPTISLIHYKRASSSRVAKQSIRAFYAAMRIFHRKHIAATTMPPVNTLIEIGITCKELLALGSNFFRPTDTGRISRSF
ncbi:MAG: glycosyltransferase family 2 protein [Chloroflexaceae bacterium]|nr:glycosyltransferase family 2 protein [Chloroflexaceae bacterium]